MKHGHAQYSTFSLDGEMPGGDLREEATEATLVDKMLYFSIQNEHPPTGSTGGAMKTRHSVSTYNEFLASKRTIAPTSGIEVSMEVRG